MRNKKVRFIISMLLLVSMLAGMGGLTAFADDTPAEQKDPVEAVKEEIGKLPTAEEAAEMNDEQKTALNDTVKTITETLDDLLKENKISEEDRDEIGAPVYALAKALTGDTPDTTDNTDDENTGDENSNDGNTGDGSNTDGNTDSGNADDTDPAVDKVKADIDALPTAEEIAAMDDTQKEALNDKLLKICDDIEALLTDGKLTKDELNQLMQRVDAVGNVLIGDAPDTAEESNAPGTKQKLGIQYDIMDDGYNIYYTTEDGQRVYIYCFNNDLTWPASSPTFDTDYYVPDPLTHLNDATKDKLYRVFYAGFPHNNVGMYIESEEGWMPSIRELDTALQPPADLLEAVRTAYPDLCDYSTLVFTVDRVMFTAFEETRPTGSGGSWTYTVYVADDYEGEVLKKMADIVFADGYAGLASLKANNPAFYIALQCFNERQGGMPCKPMDLQYAFMGNAYEAVYMEGVNYDIPDTYTKQQAHDSTQAAIWQVLFESGVPNNHDLTGSLDILAQELVEFANGTGPYSSAVVPPRSTTIADMTAYKNTFESGAVLLDSGNNPVGSRNIVFTQGLDNRYYSEELHFASTAWALPYEFKLVDASGNVIDHMDFTLHGNGSIILESNSKPPIANIVVTSGNYVPSDVFLYVNERQKDIPLADKSHDGLAPNGEHFYQDMGGVYFKTVPISLTLGTTFNDRGTTSLEFKKIWNDSDDLEGLRPESVEIKLYTHKLDAEGNITDEQLVAGVAPIILSERDAWYGEFKDLPILTDGSHYAVKETAVPGYTAVIDCGMEGHHFNVHTCVIINTHEVTVKPTKINISGTKVWAGDTPTDRPASIVVKLFADGAEVTHTTVQPDADGTWSWSFNDQPKEKVIKNGSGEEVLGPDIVYTVEEIPVTGYDSAVTGTAAGGFTITNTKHVEAVRSASLTLPLYKLVTGDSHSFDAGGKKAQFNIYKSNSSYSYNIGNKIETLSVTFENGTVKEKAASFAPLKYSSDLTAAGTLGGAGDYYYVIRELPDDWSKTDMHEYHVHVKVSESASDTALFDITADINGHDAPLTLTGSTYTVTNAQTVSFTNTLLEAEYVVPVVKKLTGRTAESTSTFSFKLSKANNLTSYTVDANNNYTAFTEATVNIKGSGAGVAGSFPELHFIDGGVYVYKLEELPLSGASASDYTADTESYELTVFVAEKTENGVTSLVVSHANMKKGTGTVQAITAENRPTFTNAFKNKASIILPVYKSIANIKNSMAGEPTFNFALYQTGSDYSTASKPVISSAQIKILKDDTASAFGTGFDILKFGTVADGSAKYLGGAGTYYFVVKETGTVAGYTMDSAEHKIELTVTQSDSGIFDISAKLNGSAVELQRTDSGLYSIKESDAAKVHFVNSYNSGATVSVTFNGTKSLTGDRRPYGIRAGEFKFEVYDAAGNVVSTGTTDANGRIIFTPILYKRADLGGAASKEYVYSISEVKGRDRYITYSRQSFNVKVTVTALDNGLLSARVAYSGGYPNFINTFHKSFIVYTGDNANIALWGALCGIAVLGIGGALFYVKKKGKKK